MNLLVIVFDMTSEDTGFISEPPIVWLGQINISKLILYVIKNKHNYYGNLPRFENRLKEINNHKGGWLIFKIKLYSLGRLWLWNLFRNFPPWGTYHLYHLCHLCLFLLLDLPCHRLLEVPFHQEVEVETSATAAAYMGLYKTGSITEIISVMSWR